MSGSKWWFTNYSVSVLSQLSSLWFYMARYVYDWTFSVGCYCCCCRLLREREGGEWEGERENSELYYTRIETLSICLFLQSVLANLHVNTYKITLRTLTTVITAMMMTMCVWASERERGGERERLTWEAETENYLKSVRTNEAELMNRVCGACARARVCVR